MFENIIHIKNINALIKFAEKVTKLSKEEEYELIRKAQNNDDSAMAMLLQSQLPSLSYHINKCRGYQVEFEDLLQEGMISLMKAIGRFDLSKGFRLVTYSNLNLRGDLFDYIKKNIRLAQMKFSKDKRKLFYALRSQKKQVGHLTEEDISNISTVLNVSRKDVVEVDGWLSNSDFPLLQDDILESQSSCVEEQAEHDQMISLVSEEVEKLGGLTSVVVARRYFEESPPTLKELSEELDVTATHVLYMQNKGVAKLKERMSAYI